MVSYNVFIVIIGIEIIVIGLLSLAIFIHRGWLFVWRPYQLKRQKIIRTICLSLLNSPSVARIDELFHWKNELLSVLEAFDRRFKGGQWLILKQEIALQYLLPEARKLAGSVFWRRRNFASRTMALFPVAEDEGALLQLMRDKEFLVSSHAIRALIHLSTRKAMQKVVERMSCEHGYAYYLFRDLIASGTKATFEHIIAFARQPNLHKTCLDLLSTKSVTLPIPFLQEDLFSKDVEVRILALRVLIRTPTKNATEIFQHFIHDENSAIRALAAKGLRDYPSDESMKLLEMSLLDSEWQVRLAAAQALKMIEPEGSAILKRQVDKCSREVAEYALRFD